MACPFFMPVEQVETNEWIQPPRRPLGDMYRGVCQADSNNPIEVAHEPCNCGYARGVCDRFPKVDAADAVRFSILADRGGRVRLIYILEKEHTPAEHGVLEYSITESRQVGGNVSELLAAQARAFVASYLQRRSDIAPRFSDSVP